MIWKNGTEKIIKMIGVIDCGIGNISSVTNLLDYIGENLL